VCDVQNNLPQIPNSTCTVTDPAYGAKGDGTTDDTVAFAKAIAACEAMGGGHVDVPAGTYSTGAIHLDDNIDLHFEMGATIMFNGNVAEYPMVQTRYQGIGIMNHSPMVYAYGKHDISVTGPGVLDASGSPTFNPRVNFFEPYSCTRVLIKDIKLLHSHFWQFHPTLVTYLWAENVTTTDDGTGNNDGFDPESCTNCVLTNSTIASHDDAMAIKSGRDDYGRTINVPTSNFVFMDSSFSSSWGLMTLGSELSGGIHDVFGYDLKTTGQGVKYVFEIKGNTLRGGTVKDIHMDTVTSSPVTGGVHGGVLWCDMLYMGQTGAYTPDYSNFSLSHATISNAPSVLDLSRTTPGATIKNVDMSDSTYTNIGSAATPYPNTSVTWTSVTLNGKAM
jgi:polygalacturonase